MMPQKIQTLCIIVEKVLHLCTFNLLFSGQVVLNVEERK